MVSWLIPLTKGLTSSSRPNALGQRWQRKKEGTVPDPSAVAADCASSTRLAATGACGVGKPSRLTAPLLPAPRTVQV